MSIVWCDEEEILQGECLRLVVLVGVLPAKEFFENGADALDFLVALLNVAIVLDATENNSAFNGDESV